MSRMHVGCNGLHGMPVAGFGSQGDEREDGVGSPWSLLAKGLGRLTFLSPGRTCCI